VYEAGDTVCARICLVGGGSRAASAGAPLFTSFTGTKVPFSRAFISKVADRAQLVQAPPCLLALLVQKYKCWRRIKQLKYALVLAIQSPNLLGLLVQKYEC
jgi:hypothetical protein